MNNKWSFSKDDTKIVKGIALIFMIIHHLFGNTWQIDKYISIPILNGNVAMYLGIFSQVCVAIFIFLSGIGMYYVNCHYKNIFLRIFKLYLEMWIVLFVVCIPLKIAAGNYEFNLIELIRCMLCINTSTYCGSWWFLCL